MTPDCAALHPGYACCPVSSPRSQGRHRGGLCEHGPRLRKFQPSR